MILRNLLPLVAVALVTGVRPVASSAQMSDTARYASRETREVVESMIAAHGGMEAFREARSISFRFFTKVVGDPSPWLSIETVEPVTGRAYLDWPLWGASIVYDGEEVWSLRWPPGPPPGFFTQLTYAFITLPWLTQQDDVRLGKPRVGRLPGDEVDYLVVRMTMERRGPAIPGSYYDLFIDRESHLLTGIGFDITHPGMVSNPDQPLGPLFHLVKEYTDLGGLKFPSYYVTRGGRGGPADGAIHVVFDLALERPFDEARLRRPDDAVVDRQSLDWWSGGR